MDFTKYLIASGLSQEDAVATAKNLKTWDDLQNWLTSHSKDRVQPKMDRLPIGTPFMETNWKKNIFKKYKDDQQAGLNVGAAPEWIKLVEWRRRTIVILSMATTIIMAIITYMLLDAQELDTAWAVGYLFCYLIMTYFMLSTFFKLVLGSIIALRGPKGNPWHPIHFAKDPKPDERVAIIFPVFHEDAMRVGAGIAATWESIMKNIPESQHHYDIFLLSDSRDDKYLVAEQAVIYNLNKQYPDARIFYRHRPSNHNAKLGNVVDFCRRWGNVYDYMFVMDADSVVSATAIHTTLRMMAGNNRLGILQTNPTPILRTSLFGRMQQFSGRLYGTVFSYSLQAMYMGHANYIGHNAMIRMKPFIDNCMLPFLSGKAPWGGKPLSHDIIEAALMARAGYEVWFLPDIKGSYEEIPANILGFVIRERRWMQGNLQHLRFLFIDGLKSIHREGFINGLMGYLSAPLWSVFLFISAYSMIGFLKSGEIKIDAVGSMEVPAILMFCASMVFLFLPRILALCVYLQDEPSKGFGGRVKMIMSMFAETIFSLFFSPLIMVYITRFLWLWIRRKSITWGTQQRDDEALTWSSCFRHFGWVSVLGCIFWVLLWWQIQTIPAQRMDLIEAASGGALSPSTMIFWFLPILGGMSASVIIVQITSRTSKFINDCELFKIPEERVVPFEVKVLERVNSILNKAIPSPENAEDVIRYATKDVFFYVNHRHEIRYRPHIAERLLPKIHNNLPMTEKEWGIAIRERACFDAIHQKYATA